MPYSVVDKPSKYFDTKLYTGNGSTQSITGLNFSPDLVWTKSRSNSGYNHQVHDVIRGANKVLWTNLTNAEGTADTNGFLSFQSDGFNLGADTIYTEVNQNGQTYASWNWDANGAGVSNTSGTITSTVSANTTSGFSIVSYTGNGTSGATFGHGLGVTPAFTIVKNRSTGGTNWQGFHQSLGNTKSHLLNSSEVPRTNIVFWNNTSPTSTLITLGNDSDVNTNGNNYIAYCFAEVKGFSKFGSYVGNGSTDGVFVYTGFTPAMIIAKNSSSAVSWTINDNKRNTFNPNEKFLYPNLSDAEGTNLNIDYLSNGFKIRATSTLANTSGETYIYACFASNPFVTSKGVPVTAR